MANVKNAFLREKIIDQCLHSRSGYSTKELMDKCNDALHLQGENPVTSPNTIRDDIRAIESRYNITVEIIRIGRNIRYRYEDPDFSIYNSSFNADDIKKLTESVAVLRRFSGMQGFEWVDELDAHIQTVTFSTPKPIVRFEDNELLEGMKWFTPLFNAINEQRAVQLGYQPYGKPFVDIIAHPYFLKQHNQRWFLFAYDEQRQSISNLPFDRIKYVQPADVRYIPNTTIDFTRYFKNIVGVTIPSGAEAETVTIHVSPEQFPYIKTNPLHHSQHIIRQNTDGSAIITINVIPNFELQQLLLSFGERITILSPQPLKDIIHQRIEKNLENYK